LGDRGVSGRVIGNTPRLQIGYSSANLCLPNLDIQFYRLNSVCASESQNFIPFSLGDSVSFMVENDNLHCKTVTKYGCSTFWTQGTVVLVEEVLPYFYVISDHPGSKFASSGDSGALLMCQNIPVGIVISEKLTGEITCLNINVLTRLFLERIPRCFTELTPNISSVSLPIPRDRVMGRIVYSEEKRGKVWRRDERGDVSEIKEVNHSRLNCLADSMWCTEERG
jgi:hypothetical protein